MPFIIQARRIPRRDTTHSLQPQCQPAVCDTPTGSGLVHQYLFNLLHVMKDTGALARYQATCTSFHTLLVPDARIMSMNGCTIPPEWLIEDGNGTHENMMLVDTRWTEADFVINEV